ncbi:MAG: hypothetical protein QM647_15205 [Asticcacaulis sp.]|uniref:LexA family protein n=1 Tax=Asticcacaulis sp. TaxID=1872648 RepID=UPI0039E21B5E
MTQLTKREQACLNSIIRLTTSDDVTPSYREIADDLGLKSVSGVAVWIGVLESKGRIRRLNNRSRSIQVINPLSVELNRLYDLFGRDAVVKAVTQ